MCDATRAASPLRAAVMCAPHATPDVPAAPCSAHCDRWVGSDLEHGLAHPQRWHDWPEHEDHIVRGEN